VQLPTDQFLSWIAYSSFVYFIFVSVINILSRQRQSSLPAITVGPTTNQKNKKPAGYFTLHPVQD
jgi:hypothetical protein